MNEKEVIENKNNKDVVLKAVSENGKFLDLVSPELQDDKEVVMEYWSDKKCRRPVKF